MNEKTKSYSWLPWLISISIIVLIGTLAFYYSWNWYRYLLDPWTAAHGLATIVAINEFSGGVADVAPHWENRIQALGSLITIFIIGPSLWMYGELKNEKGSDGDQDHLKKGFFWYLGAVMICGGLTLAVPATITKGIVFNNTWESAAKYQNVDELRGELVSLAFDAAEEFYLASDEGRGFAGLELEALKSYKAGTSNSFVLADENDSDSTLVIYGVGYKEGLDPDFKNINGEEGKIQLAVQVEPMSDIFKLIKTNTNKPF